MNTLPVNFEFNSNTIRVIEIDGEPWFVARDAAMILFGRTNNYRIPYSVTPSERRIFYKQYTSSILLPLFKGRASKLALLSESGLYKLILRSDKPEARALQNWVTGTVLPAIRKNGGYVMGQEKAAAGEMSEDDLIFKAMQVMQGKVDQCALGSNLRLFILAVNDAAQRSL